MATAAKRIPTGINLKAVADKVRETKEALIDLVSAINADERVLMIIPDSQELTGKAKTKIVGNLRRLDEDTLDTGLITGIERKLQTTDASVSDFANWKLEKRKAHVEQHFEDLVDDGWAIKVDSYLHKVICEHANQNPKDVTRKASKSLWRDLSSKMKADLRSKAEVRRKMEAVPTADLEAALAFLKAQQDDAE